jgi:uncharacterized protein (DUF58 family)
MTQMQSKSIRNGHANGKAGHSWLRRAIRSPLDRLAGRLSRLAGIGPRGADRVASLMQDPNPQRYLDPAVLAKFGLSPLIAKMVVEGFISGLHRSPFHGFSVEFADHREYVPGDDLKFLDWQLYARTDHYYIKRYEEETNLRCHILLDRSASMAFGTGAITKWDYACFLSTCLAYLMTKQQDAVGLALLGQRPGLLLPPRCRSSHLRQMMQAMIQNPPAGETDLAGSLLAMVRNLKRRALVVLVSDLIDDPEQTLKAIRLLGSHKHDVVVFHVQDAAEIDFSFSGPTLFRDMETGEELEVDPASARDAYREEIEAMGRFYKKGLTEVGIDYHPINTRQPYDVALSTYLQQRARINR